LRFQLEERVNGRGGSAVSLVILAFLPQTISH
jgi:hypothetical protein